MNNNTLTFNQLNSAMENIKDYIDAKDNSTYQKVIEDQNKHVLTGYNGNIVDFDKITEIGNYICSGAFANSPIAFNDLNHTVLLSVSAVVRDTDYLNIHQFFMYNNLYYTRILQVAYYDTTKVINNRWSEPAERMEYVETNENITSTKQAYITNNNTIIYPITTINQVLDNDNKPIGENYASKTYVDTSIKNVTFIKISSEDGNITIKDS